jgi:hypothetical protein
MYDSIEIVGNKSVVVHARTPFYELMYDSIIESEMYNKTNYWVFNKTIPQMMKMYDYLANHTINAAKIVENCIITEKVPKIVAVYDFWKNFDFQLESFVNLIKETPTSFMILCFLLLILFILQYRTHQLLLQEYQFRMDYINKSKFKPVLKTHCFPKKKVVLIDMTCCICLEDSTEYMNKALFNCNHSCCVSCTSHLLSKIDSTNPMPCPMCRADIKTVTLPYTMSRAKNAPKVTKEVVINSPQAKMLKPYCK